MTLAAAINRGLRKALEDDPRVVLFGEDIGALGGVFRITDGLQKDFGDRRVIDAPLAEAGIVGTGVGMAMSGLRIMAPGTPHDAYWGIQEAIASEVPVMFFEPKRRYWMKGEVGTADPAACGSFDPAGGAVVRRPGEDVTLVTYGPLVTTALDVAAAAQDDGVSVEVVDLRVISPVDIDTVVTSVRKTGRLVIAHEAPTSFGVGAEIAARVRKKCFYDLEAPMIRVGGFHTPYPASRSEHHYLPDVDRILDGIDRALEYGGGEHEYSPVQAPRRRRGPHGSGHPDLESRCR
ncbi:alpha-ketoacid dehydrogenase subunit beta [Kocuria marina]|uniref:alpha-ketoacid dehydrogenase subunit beta n=2 Tax=Kocuria marina TaxID=223184 RepID=UPI00119F5406|nr:transketolase C-terminal domain-containing protein [Kocuria indica]